MHVPRLQRALWLSQNAGCQHNLETTTNNERQQMGDSGFCWSPGAGYIGKWDGREKGSGWNGVGIGACQRQGRGGDWWQHNIFSFLPG